MSARHLIVGGTTKAATTSLFAWLAAHPGVSAARIKETRFFLDLDYPLDSKHRYPDGLETYAAFFAPPDGRLRVEATPDYLYSAGCAERIARALPDVRVAFSLRDPVARLHSWYRFARQTDRLERGETFEHYLERQLAPGTPRAEQALRALEQGRYASYLERYLDALGAARVHVLFFEDLAAAPLAAMEALARFAGLDPEFYRRYRFVARNPTREMRSPALHRATMRLAYHLRNLTYRAPPVMAAFRGARRALAPLVARLGAAPERAEPLRPQTRARLVEYYAPSVRALERLLGRSVPWVDFRAPDVLSAS
jgi:hypothetical protein